jgi:hypothetical protein
MVSGRASKERFDVCPAVGMQFSWIFAGSAGQRFDSRDCLHYRVMSSIQKR